MITGRKKNYLQINIEKLRTYESSPNTANKNIVRTSVLKHFALSAPLSKNSKLSYNQRDQMLLGVSSKRLKEGHNSRQVHRLEWRITISGS
jgi:hypothetical protein